jgi:hypothetical protein
MFDRIELIKALNSTLELMFDGFCQVCSRLAIYKKMRKNLCQLNLALKDISFSSPSRLHHQAVLTTRPSSPPSRPHHQAVLTKPFSPSRFYQAVLIIKQFSSPSSAHHQAILSSDRSKSTYQVNLSSHLIKSFLLKLHLIKSVVYEVIKN